VRQARIGEVKGVIAVKHFCVVTVFVLVTYCIIPSVRSRVVSDSTSMFVCFHCVCICMRLCLLFSLPVSY
jgi:hypothetical protein